MVDPDLAEKVIRQALARGGDFAEIFFERHESASASIDDRKIASVADSSWMGVGIRVVSGESTGFAHTADTSEAGLLRAAETASRIARSSRRAPAMLDATPFAIDERSISGEHKRRGIGALQQIDEVARAGAAAIIQVSASLSATKREIIVANSLGRYVHDSQWRSRASALAVARGDTGLQTGYEVFAKSVDFDTFLSEFAPARLSGTAVKRAITKLQSRPAPSGVLPVVLAKGSGGILFHEACGHGLEADHIVKNSSVYAGKLGKTVASSLVTLVDDGSIDREWGTFAVDDEGNPAQRNTLIEDGVLVDYLMDYRSAKSFDHGPRGNGRRQDYRSLPMVRMTNTFLLPGDSDAEEIVAGTERGVYVAALSGGQVNTTTGDFVFGTQEAYLIENGRITAPIRDTQLIGNGPAVLGEIDAVGSDFGMNAGTCGKEGQSVPVGTGQPTLRIRSITLGGTSGG